MTSILDILTRLLHHAVVAQAGGGGPIAGGSPEEAGIGEILVTYGKWGVAALILAGIALVVHRFVGGGGLALKVEVDRETRKEIKTCLKNENFIGAAEAALRAEAFEDAADFFVKGKEFRRAAEAFVKANKRNDAITYYKRGGEPQRAAELLEKAGQFRTAGTEFLNAGDTPRAAELFMKGKDFRRAAELYEELGQWKDAGEAFERLSARPEAAEAYERYFEQEHGLVRGRVRKLPKEVREKAFFAAEVFEEQRNIDRASKLLERAGYIVEAAELLAAAKRYEAAAELFLEAKRPLEAARIFDAHGHPKKAAFHRGEAALIKGEQEEAAEHFAAAGEFTRAADLYVDLGERLKAAQMYEASKDVRFAAEQYAMADRFADAARCFEEAGDFQRAAETFQQLGDLDGEVRCLEVLRAHYKLGRLMLEHGRKAEALAQLQKVDRMDANFADACEIQGDLLREMGQSEVALGKYRLTVDNAEPSAANLSVYYKMAQCLEKLGDLPSAQRIYERILSVDYYFEDTQARVESIRRTLTEEVQQPGSGNHSMGWRRNSPSSRNIVGNSPASRPISRPSGGALNPTGPLRYEIIDEIARGGMGVVFRAKDTVLNRTVAYKILSESLKNNPTAVKYFLREARAAAALSHQNIVTVYDAGEQNGEYYMAMELVHGETLKSLITRSGPFHEKLIRFILVHSCRGLAYAHQQTVVHRDIKSGNMMLTKDKTLKIMDFGLAKFLEEYQSQHTKAIGTPFYMSPEQILGRDLDHRSDLYSLGVTLFECATGTVPFFKGELSYHHLHTPPPSPRSLNPNLSPTMERVILTLLEKDPNKRFQSANDILKSLKTR